MARSNCAPFYAFGSKWRTSEKRADAASTRRAAVSASIIRTRIRRKVLQFIRLALPLLRVCRRRFFDLNIWPNFRYFAFSNNHSSSPGSVSGFMASTGHSGTQTPQSMIRPGGSPAYSRPRRNNPRGIPPAVHGFAANAALIDDVGQSCVLSAARRGELSSRRSLFG